MLTSDVFERSDACCIYFDVAQRSGARGAWVTLILTSKGRIRPLTLIFLMQKNSNFPQQHHHAGNIGLKTSSFLLLSTHVWPKVWMRSLRDAWMSDTKEI